MHTLLAISISYLSRQEQPYLDSLKSHAPKFLLIPSVDKEKCSLTVFREENYAKAPDWVSRGLGCHASENKCVTAG